MCDVKESKPYGIRVPLLLKVVCHKQSLLFQTRISAVVTLKASVFAPIIRKVISSVVIAAILEIDELHGAGVDLALLQSPQLSCTLDTEHEISSHDSQQNPGSCSIVSLIQ